MTFVGPGWGEHRWTDLCATHFVSDVVVASLRCVVAESGGVSLTRFDAFGDSASRVAHSPCPPFVNRVAISHDGALVVGWAVLGKTLEVFKPDTLELVASVKAPGAVLAAAFAHDGASVFVACAGKTIRRVSLDTGRAQRGVSFDFAAEANGTGLAAWRDGRWLVAWSPGGGVRLWRLDDSAAEDLAPKSEPGSCSHAAAFSEDRAWIFYSRADGVFLRDLASAEPSRRLDLDLGPDARLLAAEPHGEFIALSARGVHVYDVAKGHLRGAVTPEAP